MLKNYHAIADIILKKHWLHQECCPPVWNQTSTKLRKHTATLYKELNLTDTEMDQLSDFLGHESIWSFTSWLKVHYNLQRSVSPGGHWQGKVSEFKGKNLDENNLKPYGKDTWHSNCYSYSVPFCNYLE